jgi:tRNA (Thr-GGU) A37 N-methylase
MRQKLFPSHFLPARKLAAPSSIGLHPTPILKTRYARVVVDQTPLVSGASVIDCQQYVAGMDLECLAAYDWQLMIATDTQL